MGLNMWALMAFSTDGWTYLLPLRLNTVFGNIERATPWEGVASSLESFGVFSEREKNSNCRKRTKQERRFQREEAK